MGKPIKNISALMIAALLFSAGAGTNQEQAFAGQTINANVRNDQADVTASGIQVAYHTQKEITEYVMAHPAGKDDKLKYKQKPLLSENYSIGELSDDTQNAALNMLKQIRYIAGISDEVTISEKYAKLTQAAAYINYANNELSHYPKQPQGVPVDLYELGAEGACQSNIAWASWSGCSINETLVDSWMEDGDSHNIDRVGHRRWLLNPKMAATAFGAVDGANGTYSAVYAFDSENSDAEEYGVCWPAQNMPTEYFGNDYPWSVSTGKVEDEVQVQVALKNVNTGKTWKFSSAEADGAFYVNNASYGDSGCIIFRPEDVKNYKDGDCYEVNITGLVNGDITYTVRFFDLYEKDVQTPEIWRYLSKPNKFKVQWNGSSEVDGYQVQYATDAKFKSKKTKNLTGKKITVNHAKNKKYYVRVRAYRISNGKTTYSKWSKSIKL